MIDRASAESGGCWRVGAGGLVGWWSGIQDHLISIKPGPRRSGSTTASRRQSPSLVSTRPTTQRVLRAIRLCGLSKCQRQCKRACRGKRAHHGQIKPSTRQAVNSRRTGNKTGAAGNTQHWETLGEAIRFLDVECVTVSDQGARPIRKFPHTWLARDNAVALDKVEAHAITTRTRSWWGGLAWEFPGLGLAAVALLPLLAVFLLCPVSCVPPSLCLPISQTRDRRQATASQRCSHMPILLPSDATTTAACVQLPWNGARGTEPETRQP